MTVPILTREPVKQQEWNKQYQECFIEKEGYEKPFKRIIDRLSIAEINEFYSKGLYPCDRCGKEIKWNEKDEISTHILHIINPHVLLCCEDCTFDDFDKGRVIAAHPDDWKTHRERKTRMERR